MAVLFLTGLAVMWWAELQPNPVTGIAASMEGKEAGGHVLKLLACALGAFALLVFAWLFFCLAVVFLLAKAFGGENGWLWASLVMAGLHLVFAGVLALRAKAGLATPLFPITTQEFKKDQEWLETTTKHN